MQILKIDYTGIVPFNQTRIAQRIAGNAIALESQADILVFKFDPYCVDKSIRDLVRDFIVEQGFQAASITMSKNCSELTIRDLTIDYNRL